MAELIKVASTLGSASPTSYSVVEPEHILIGNNKKKLTDTISELENSKTQLEKKIEDLSSQLNSTQSDLTSGSINYVKNSHCTLYLNCNTESNSFSELKLVDDVIDKPFTEDGVYAWVSYYIRDWRYDFDPTFQGINLGNETGNNSKDWHTVDDNNKGALVEKGYKQIDARTRRYWFKFKTKGYTLKRLYFYAGKSKTYYINSKETKTVYFVSNHSGNNIQVYNIMLSFGSSLTDYKIAEVDNTVGGRNLCLGTTETKSVTTLTNGNKYVKIGAVSDYARLVGLPVNTPITISVTVTAADDVTVLQGMWCNTNSNSDSGDYRHVLFFPNNVSFKKGIPKRISSSQILYNDIIGDSTTAKYFFIGMSKCSSSVKLTYSDFKVELGGVATSWTIAPEDNETTKDNLEEIYDDIYKLNDKNEGGRNLCLGTANPVVKSLTGNRFDFKIGGVSGYTVKRQIAIGEKISVSFNILYDDTDTKTTPNTIILNTAYISTRKANGLTSWNTFAKKEGFTITLKKGVELHISCAGLSVYQEYHSNGTKNPLEFTSDRYWFICLMADKTYSNSKFTISNFKVELGSKETNWTVAPEDLTTILQKVLNSAIDKSDVEYALSTSSKVEPIEEAWQTEALAPTADKPSLWSRTVVYKENGDKIIGPAKCIEVIVGKLMDQNPIELYCLVDGNGKTQSDKWYVNKLKDSTGAYNYSLFSTTLPKWIKYCKIFTCTKIVYTDGTITYSEPRCELIYNDANQLAQDLQDQIANIDSELTNSRIIGRNLALKTHIALTITASTSNEVEISPWELSEYAIKGNNGTPAVYIGANIAVSFDLSSPNAVNFSTNTAGYTFRLIVRDAKNNTNKNRTAGFIKVENFKENETKHIKAAFTISGLIDKTNYGWSEANNATTGDKWGLSVYKVNKKTTFTITNFKVELGKNASTWQSAPEDIEAVKTLAENAKIKNTDVVYAVNTSDTTAPAQTSKEWNTDIKKVGPTSIDKTTKEVNDGKTYYLWSRTDIETEGNGIQYGTPICLGSDWFSGEEQYYLSTSSSLLSGGSWSATLPTWENGKYIWTSTLITWKNGSKSRVNVYCSTLFNDANQRAQDVKDIEDLNSKRENSIACDKHNLLNRNLIIPTSNIATNESRSFSGAKDNNNLYYNLSSDILINTSADGTRKYFDFSANKEEQYVYVSYYTDGVNPVTLICIGSTLESNTTNDSDNWWNWGINAADASGCIQETSTTYRYWYRWKTNGHKLMRCAFYAEDGSKSKIYKVMLSVGGSLIDWRPSPEDIAYNGSSTISNLERISKTMALSSADDNMYLDLYNLSNFTKNVYLPPVGFAHRCYTRDTVIGNKFQIEKGLEVTVECVAKGIKGSLYDDVCPLRLGVYLYDINGNLYSYTKAPNTNLTNISAWSTLKLAKDLGAADKDDEWHRYRVKITIPGYSSLTGPKYGRFYVLLDYKGYKIDLGDVFKYCNDESKTGAYYVSNITIIPTSYNYLEDALEEAASDDSVTLKDTNGLVLKRFIGVLNNSHDAIVAGLNGTTDATSENLPMIWAGATSNLSESMNSAPFRVYNDGRTYMSMATITGQASDATGVMIKDGEIKLGAFNDNDYAEIDEGNAYMSISPRCDKKNINELLNKSDTASLKTLSINSKVISTATSQVACTGGSNATFTSRAEESKILLGSTGSINNTNYSNFPESGTLYFKFDSANLTATLDATATLTTTATLNSKNTLISTGCRIYISKSDGTLYSLIDFRPSGFISSASISKGTDDLKLCSYYSIPYKKGDTFSVYAEVYIQGGASYTSSTTLTSANIPFIKANVTLKVNKCDVSFSPVASMYKNEYFGNGMLLSSAGNRYFAVHSEPNDNLKTIFLAKTTTAEVKLNLNGFFYKNHSNTNNYFYRMNPLIFIGKTKYNNSVYSLDSSYNPFNLTVKFSNINSSSKKNTEQLTINITYPNNAMAQNCIIRLDPYGFTDKWPVGVVINASYSGTIGTYRVVLPDINGSISLGAFVFYIYDLNNY